MWCPVSGCPTDGGLSYPTIFANTGIAAGLAVNISGVYWAMMNGPIMTCPLTGCVTEPDGGIRPGQIATSQNPDFMGVDSAKVYWADEGTGTQYTIYDCFLNGCDLAPGGGFIQPEITAQVGQVQSLSVDSSGVYWLFYRTT
jgi:hypothetical protein